MIYLFREWFYFIVVPRIFRICCSAIDKIDPQKKTPPKKKNTNIFAFLAAREDHQIFVSSNVLSLAFCSFLLFSPPPDK